MSTRVTEEVTKSTKCDKEATSQKPVVKGQNIESVILEMPKRQGLDLKSCVGIRTIGWSIMISAVKGAISEIEEEFQML